VGKRKPVAVKKKCYTWAPPRSPAEVIAYHNNSSEKSNPRRMPCRRPARITTTVHACCARSYQKVAARLPAWQLPPAASNIVVANASCPSTRRRIRYSETRERNAPVHMAGEGTSRRPEQAGETIQPEVKRQARRRPRKTARQRRKCRYHRAKGVNHHKPSRHCVSRKQARRAGRARAADAARYAPAQAATRSRSFAKWHEPGRSEENPEPTPRRTRPAPVARRKW